MRTHSHGIHLLKRSHTNTITRLTLLTRFTSIRRDNYNSAYNSIGYKFQMGGPRRSNFKVHSEPNEFKFAYSPYHPPTPPWEEYYSPQSIAKFLKFEMDVMPGISILSRNLEMISRSGRMPISKRT